MKLKYYMRGIGIGIIVTALLMGYSNHANAVKNNSYIKENVQEENASTSGLTLQENANKNVTEKETINEIESENSVVDADGTKQEESVKETEPVKAAETLKETENTKIEEPVKETEPAKADGMLKETENTKIEEPVKETEPVKLEEPVKSTEPVKLEENTKETLKQGTTVKIQVNSGEGSGTVARKLEQAGVVDNAKEFDAYLMQHGYDKKIAKGEHEVTVGSTWMEIAKQITGAK